MFLDEDVPGGCTAYDAKSFGRTNDAYKYLDSKPITISAKNTDHLTVVMVIIFQSQIQNY